MIRRMRFFSNFVVANVRDDAVGADGKPARAKLKENRLREARKGQTEREIIYGKPENEKLGVRDLREGRERETQRMTLAESPQKGFLTFDARGSPARGRI